MCGPSPWSDGARCRSSPRTPRVRTANLSRTPMMCSTLAWAPNSRSRTTSACASTAASCSHPPRLPPTATVTSVASTAPTTRSCSLHIWDSVELGRSRHRPRPYPLRHRKTLTATASPMSTTPAQPSPALRATIPRRMAVRDPRTPTATASWTSTMPARPSPAPRATIPRRTAARRPRIPTATASPTTLTSAPTSRKPSTVTRMRMAVRTRCLPQ